MKGKRNIIVNFVFILCTNGPGKSSGRSRTEGKQQLINNNNGNYQRRLVNNGNILVKLL